MIMRHWILASMAAVSLTGAGVGRAGDLNIRVIVAGQIAPGIYGQVDLGDEPPPPLVYAQPMLIVPVARPLPPVYLYVPPGHVRYWRRYCHQYNACSRPVYFVRPPEYEPGYVRGYYGDDGYYYRGDDGYHYRGDDGYHYRDDDSDYRHEERHRRHRHDDEHERDENDDG
jgi:hypothetical protein